MEVPFDPAPPAPAERYATSGYGLFKAVAFLQLGVFGLLAYREIVLAGNVKGIGAVMGGLPPEQLYLDAAALGLTGLCLLRLLLYLPDLDAWTRMAWPPAKQAVSSFGRSFFISLPFLLRGACGILVLVFYAASEASDLPQTVEWLPSRFAHKGALVLIGLALEDLRRMLLRQRHALPKASAASVSYKVYWAVWVAGFGLAVFPVWSIVSFLGILSATYQSSLVLYITDCLVSLFCVWSVCSLLAIWCEVVAARPALTWNGVGRQGLAALVVLALATVLGYAKFAPWSQLARSIAFPPNYELLSWAETSCEWMIPMAWLIFLWQFLRWKRAMTPTGDILPPGDQEPPRAGAWRILGWALLALWLWLMWQNGPLTSAKYFAPIGALLAETADLHRSLWLREHAAQA